MNERITIIIPVYNVERFLCQCLDSIINQTYTNLEIILVDDGSPDNCGSICDEYAAKDSRIIVVHKPNGGLSAARNEGIIRATGDWIAFVDSDDWCEPDFYEQLLQSCRGKQADIILSGGRILELEKKSKIERHFPENFYFTEREHITNLMSNWSSFASPWDKMFRGELIKKNKLQYDVGCKVFEDVLFNFQAFDCATSLIGCPVVGYHNRVTSTGITQSFNLNKFKESYYVVEKMHNYTERYDLGENATHAVDVVALIAVSSSLNKCYFNPQNKKPYKEIVAEIKKIKGIPLIHRAIWSNDNRNMNKRQVFLKYALRLPWVWPIKLLHTAKEMLLAH